ncbi:S8 family peptidase [Paenibacillus sp. 481]|uniref:S8 family peptidase n=1 Tax=Paenibacillus sp. 481 TaxID=2835869 RepID=UPI001E3F459B|nr:S8 family peptidase [Paenibacillus sp. 481]UHA75243.1 S8 family peptidase [Paenibacillus sp. 481]
MDVTGFLHLLLQELSSSDSNTRNYFIRFHNIQLFNQCRVALEGLQKEHILLQRIRVSPLIHALMCPLSDDGKRILELNGRDWSVEDDVLIQMHAATRKPVAWESGVPWGVRQIKAPQAWSTTTGHRIQIGVIDTGADFRHPDLQHALMRGVNFVHRGLPPHDDNGHGTHIAGTIAASNQIYGIIGVAPRALIHPVKAFDENGSAYVSDIVQGIDWCVRNELNIINMSFGMKSRSKSLLSAVTNAYNAGVTIVASSGNDSKRKSIDYPARYTQTISVGATDKLHRIAPFSNRGRYVDIYAPGEKIVSSWLKGKYHEMSGTSMATSHVSGAIALLLAMNPELNPGEIKALLRRSANPTRCPINRSKTTPVSYEIDVSRLLKEAER